MELEINGQRQTVDDAAKTVAEILEGLDVDGERGVAVAVNDRVVPRGRWDDETITDGDRLEIIRATQGG